MATKSIWFGTSQFSQPQARIRIQAVLILPLEGTLQSCTGAKNLVSSSQGNKVCILRRFKPTIRQISKATTVRDQSEIVFLPFSLDSSRV